MPESAMIITPLHILYLVGVVSVLAVMVLRRDTPLVCTLFLFLLGALGLHSFIGGIQTVFNAILYAAREFMGDEALQLFLEKRYDDFKSRITSKCRNLLNCPDICCGEGGN